MKEAILSSANREAHSPGSANRHLQTVLGQSSRLPSRPGLPRAADARTHHVTTGNERIPVSDTATSPGSTRSRDHRRSHEHASPWLCSEPRTRCPGSTVSASQTRRPRRRGDARLRKTARRVSKRTFESWGPGQASPGGPEPPPAADCGPGPSPHGPVALRLNPARPNGREDHPATARVGGKRGCPRTG